MTTTRLDEPRAVSSVDVGTAEVPVRTNELFARKRPDVVLVDERRQPPGPGEGYKATEDLLEWMRSNAERYGDIYQSSLYGQRVYVINSPEAADHVLLRNWRNYPRKGQAVKRIALSLGNGLISSNGEVWARQRRMIQPAFKRESIRVFFDVFQRVSAALLAKWQGAARLRTSVDVTLDVSLAVLEATLVSIFGSDYDRVAPDFALIADESRNMQFAQDCIALGKLVAQVAADRRRDGIDGNDMLGQMMRARDRDGGHPMPDAELARHAMTLVIAGHETTASVLNWIWYLLARHPEVEARLGAEIDAVLGDQPLSFDRLGDFVYARQIIEEALRTYPPLWLITRKAVSADHLGGYFVPAGTEIYMSPYLLQRHPRYWEDPDRFDPGRFAAGETQERHPLAACPFGAGPRNCIGEFFARVEMQAHLLLIARELRLHHDDERAADFTAGVNLVSRHHFIMQPELRRL
jgi:enediyne biosynthesis protein E7